MNEFTNIWNMIVQTNTFNFAILVLIFAVIFVKLDAGKLVDKIKIEIINAIETAKTERDRAKKELLAAKSTVKNLDAEIKAIKETADKNAKTISKQILDEAKSKIGQIEINAQKAIEAESKNISDCMTVKAINSSINIARDRINSLLSDNEELHLRFIDKCLDEIDRIKI